MDNGEPKDMLYSSNGILAKTAHNYINYSQIYPMNMYIIEMRSHVCLPNDLQLA